MVTWSSVSDNYFLAITRTESIIIMYLGAHFKAYMKPNEEILGGDRDGGEVTKSNANREGGAIYEPLLLRWKIDRGPLILPQL